LPKLDSPDIPLSVYLLKFIIYYKTIYLNIFF
jgi:hypothetical protein